MFSQQRCKYIFILIFILNEAVQWLCFPLTTPTSVCGLTRVCVCVCILIFLIGIIVYYCEISYFKLNESAESQVPSTQHAYFCVNFQSIHLFCRWISKQAPSQWTDDIWAQLFFLQLALSCFHYFKNPIQQKP